MEDRGSQEKGETNRQQTDRQANIHRVEGESQEECESKHADSERNRKKNSRRGRDIEGKGEKRHTRRTETG